MCSKDNVCQPNSSFFSTSSRGGERLPYSVEVMAAYVTKLSPGSLLVLYVIDKAASALCVVRAWGENSKNIERLRIPLGQRLSGRVASTSQAVYSADAALDLSGELDLELLRFGTCSATPVIARTQVLGVLTIYLPATSSTIAIQDGSLEFAGAHLSTYLSSLHLSC